MKTSKVKLTNSITLKLKTMAGLLLWAILIIFIAECACPGLIWVTLGLLAAYWAIYYGIMFIVDRIKHRV